MCSVWPQLGQLDSGWRSHLKMTPSLAVQLVLAVVWELSGDWSPGLCSSPREPLHEHLGFLTAWRLVPGGQGGIFMTNHIVWSGSHKGQPRFQERGPARTPLLDGAWRGPRGACEGGATAQPSLGNTACHKPSQGRPRSVKRFMSSSGKSKR